MVDELRRDVTALCALGPRNVFEPGSLAAAAMLIARELGGAVDDAGNIIADVPGATSEIVVIGAHYDSVDGSPGADDNASGVAALFALARRFAREKPHRTLRFVAFVNEEPPHFQTEDMGSYQYARSCHERGERIGAMLSIESIAYYTDEPRSQQYPLPLSAFYPSTGNFIGFVGDLASRALVMQCVRAFRNTVAFPAEAAVLPRVISEVGWSDQWSFWQFGWPAIMITDTAPYRNPHYHTPTDRPETLDYARFATVVEGLVGVVRALAAY